MIEIYLHFKAQPVDSDLNHEDLDSDSNPDDLDSDSDSSPNDSDSDSDLVDSDLDLDSDLVDLTTSLYFEFSIGSERVRKRFNFQPLSILR